MRLLRFASLVSILLSSFSLRAQDPPRRDAQALQVLHQSLAAMGGTGADGRVRDTVAQVTVAWPENPGVPPVPTTITTRGADQIRIDSTAEGRTSSVIHSRGRHVRSDGNGWKVAHSANSHFRRIQHLPALLLAQELARADFAATYVGVEKVGSQDAHHIGLSRISARGDALDAKFTTDSELEVFIDTSSLAILKLSYTYFSAIDWRIGLPMEIHYTDYRSIGGMLVPFTQRTVFNGNPIYELKLTAVAFNQGIADAVFVGR